MKNKKYFIILLSILTVPFLYFEIRQHTTPDPISLVSVQEFSTKISEGEKIINDLLLRYSLEIKKQHKPKNHHDVKKDYSIDANEVFSNHSHTMLSNTYAGAGTTIGPDLLDFLALTDSLEVIWNQRADNLKTLIPWQYAYHLSSNTVRMYPWINFSQIFGPKSDWSMVRYFNNLNAIKKVENKPFCTRLYDDAGGTGLGFSCCRIETFNKQYNKSIAVCVDLSLKELLNELRIKLATENQCIEKLLFHSTALPIAYTIDVLVDIRTGIIHKGDSFLNQFDSKKRMLLKRFEMLNVEVYLIKGCE